MMTTTHYKMSRMMTTTQYQNNKTMIQSLQFSQMAQIILTLFFTLNAIQLMSPSFHKDHHEREEVHYEDPTQWVSFQVPGLRT